MRKLLLCAATALSLAALATSPATAAPTISISACTPGVFGTPCTPIGLPLATGGLPQVSLASGPAFGGENLSGTGSAGVGLNSAFFDSQTIDLTTSGGLINIYFTITDVATQGLPLLFTSTFTSNQQQATTHSVIYSSYMDNGNVANALTTLLATDTLNSNVTSNPPTFLATPAAMVSFTELYQIELLGWGPQNGGTCRANLTIDLDAAQVPEPASLALLGAGLFGLGWAKRKRAA